MTLLILLNKLLPMAQEVANRLKNAQWYSHADYLAAKQTVAELKERIEQETNQQDGCHG